MADPDIWKSPIPLNKDGIATIKLPAGATILCAHEQHGQIMVWYTADPDAEKVDRRFATVMTGFKAPLTDNRYLGTVFLAGGAFVLHIFELIDRHSEKG